MYRRTVSLTPFVRTVMVFLKRAGNVPLPLYVTLISPFSPGSIGFFVYEGTVQPQLAIACFITRGVFPVFVNVKTHFCTGSLSGNLPKSYVVFSNLISAYFFVPEQNLQWTTIKEI